MFGIPEKLIGARMYNDGSQYLGLATITFPDFQQVTASLKGSGIAGEMEVPVTGYLQSLSVRMQFNAWTPQQLSLLAQGPQELTARCSVDVTEPLTGLLTQSAIKAWMKGRHKNTTGGKGESGTTMDSESEMELSAMGVWIDGTEYVYFDKFNYIYRVNGIDYLAAARVAEGL